MPTLHKVKNKKMTTNQILKEKVENSLDTHLITNNISINAIGTEITLQGTVNNYDEKDKIEEITWNTFGVLSVNNELSICNEI
jgi:osmotically-inducible protein OsmY